MLFDDVPRFIVLVLSLLFFLTPIIYPLPSGGAFRLNPITQLLDPSRSWLIGADIPSGFYVVTALSLVGLVLAWLFYRLARPHVVERLS